MRILLAALCGFVLDLLLGDPAHPEVMGIRGHCSGPSFVFSSEEELEELLRKVSGNRLYEKALDLLSGRDYCRKELSVTSVSAMPSPCVLTGKQKKRKKPKNCLSHKQIIVQSLQRQGPDFSVERRYRGCYNYPCTSERGFYA